MIVLKRTCSACPEQYDAILDSADGEYPIGAQVGYLRMRHGEFRVDFPECGGENIYTAWPNGDGAFDDGERDYYLRFAVDAIERRLENGPPLERPSAPDVQYKIVK